MRYYITDITQPKGFREVTEEEFNEFKQELNTKKNYAEQVNNGEITLSDVPEEYREWVYLEVERMNGIATETKAQAYDILVGNEE